MDEELLEPCPMCNGENLPMGDLGRLIWYRCQYCGWVYRILLNNEEMEETVKARPDENE